MYTNRTSAIFENRERTEQAILELRSLGLTDLQLSVVAQHHDLILVKDDTVGDTPVQEIDADKTGKGLAAGAGLGALFGLASAFIPGIGPFMAAGALAATIGTIGASTVAGALVGGATGALAGALTNIGYNEDESKFYGVEIERGGYLVSVDTTGSLVTVERVREVFHRHGGLTAPTAVRV